MKCGRISLHNKALHYVCTVLTLPTDTSEEEPFLQPLGNLVERHFNNSLLYTTEVIIMPRGIQEFNNRFLITNAYFPLVNQ